MLRSTEQPAIAATGAMLAQELKHDATGAGSNLNTCEAANFLGMSAATLKVWRARDKGPPYYRGLRREVLYRTRDLINFRESHRVTPGHEPAEAA